MGILTDDMKRLVEEQKLAFHATVCPDGSPNLSIANIQAGSLMEINVVDPFVRKGYRFKGPALIHGPGSAAFDAGIERMLADGSKLTGRVEVIVVIEVRYVAPLVSPAYDDAATTEAEMLESQRARFARLHERQAGR